jgi:hypothetical protein
MAVRLTIADADFRQGAQEAKPLMGFVLDVDVLPNALGIEVPLRLEPLAHLVPVRVVS